MRILFVSCCCGTKENEKLFLKRNKKIIIPSQKFFYLLLNGITEDESVDVTCISARPISVSTSKQRIWEESTEELKNNFRFVYLPFINGRFSRFVSTMQNCKKYVSQWCIDNEGEDCCIITDSLIWTVAIPTQQMAKKYGVKCCTFITDLPEFANVKSKKNILRKALSYIISHRSKKSINKYDGYILISKYMADIIHKKSIKYIVMESSIDCNAFMSSSEGLDVVKNKRVFMYAGGVYRKYGLEAFAQAFSESGADAEFWIFGDGDFADFLVKNPNAYKNVKYMGCVSVEDIVKYEKLADILVNPRPVGEPYTKYSFPSKTAEYMSVGVPVLTTKLLGIPNDYDPYLLYFDGDDKQSYIAGIERVMNMTDDELKTIGVRALAFCIEQKTNTAQGKRITEFIDSL